jgi:acyl carrier protein
MRGGGLIAPAILETQARDTDAMMAAMRDIVARTRSGRLRNRGITQGTMTDLRAAFREGLAAVSPDLDAASIGESDHLQDDLGRDSMDFLNLVSALYKRFGLPSPESDDPGLATPAKAVDYLTQTLSRQG